MKPLELVLGIHLHQPVGNFPAVLEDSYRNAYLPFLETFRKFRSLHLVWHCTGFLLDWLDEAHPEYLDMVSELAAAGRLEVLTGGYYEPIFPVIPHRDRLAQIEKLSQRIRERFRTEPRGVWLAERVWEPGLVSDLWETGVKYVSLDDYHFFSSGLLPRQLDGYFMVEELDRAVSAFPISETMRYLIPWAENDRILEEFRTLQQLGQNLAVMIDDGEKFGAWPGTREWVYDKGWLEGFFGMVEENPDIVRTTTLQRYWGDNPPVGRAALPSASYVEMGQWALPAERALQFEEWKERFEKAGSFTDLKPFFRGGVWRNFLVKYPEANYLQKRVILLSREFDAPGRQELAAYDHLLRAQCNDVYWHGVFGGLYFPHLRHEAYRNLLEAQKGLDALQPEVLAQGPRIWREDFDLDRSDEYLINHRELFAVISPAQGGSLLELSYKPCSFNLLATLARWREKYHLSTSGTRVVQVEGKTDVAHRVNEELFFDSTLRTSCREALFASLPRAEDLRANRPGAAIRFDRTPFRALGDGSDGRIPLVGQIENLTLRKTYIPHPTEPRLRVEYGLEGPETFGGWLGVEWTIGVAGGNDPEKCVYPLGDRLAARGLGTPGSFSGISGFTLEDRRDGFILDFHLPSGSEVCYWPVETTSLAIDTLEHTFQGLGFTLFLPLSGEEPQPVLEIAIRPNTF